MMAKLITRGKKGNIKRRPGFRSSSTTTKGGIRGKLGIKGCIEKWVGNASRLALFVARGTREPRGRRKNASTPNKEGRGDIGWVRSTRG